MKLLVVAVLGFALAGCMSISPSSIRPDGLLVVRVTDPEALWIDGQAFTVLTLEDALKRLDTNESLKRIEFRINPDFMKKHPGIDCSLSGIGASVHVGWRSYIWSPENETKLTETACSGVMLAN